MTRLLTSTIGAMALALLMSAAAFPEETFSTHQSIPVGAAAPPESMAALLLSLNVTIIIGLLALHLTWRVTAPSKYEGSAVKAGHALARPDLAGAPQGTEEQGSGSEGNSSRKEAAYRLTVRREPIDPSPIPQEAATEPTEYKEASFGPFSIQTG